MFDDQKIPSNLPTGNSMLDSLDTEKRENNSNSPNVSVPTSKAEKLPPQPKHTPVASEPADLKSAEDIFGNFKEPKSVSGGVSLEHPASVGENITSEKQELQTEVSTPHQSFKRLLIIIVSIAVFAGIVFIGGYFAYNAIFKPKPFNPILNIDISNQPLQQQQIPVAEQQDVQALPPQVIDTDNDGLTDEEELALGTSQFNPDSDGDRLFDREEVEVYGTDPLNPDTDGDGYMDGAEVQGGYDPKGPGKLIKIPPTL